MLSVLVMTHSIITVVSDRTIVWFYVPKFIVVGIIWIYTVVFVSIISFYSQVGGFAFGSNRSTIYPFLIILFILLMVYVINLIYFVIRALAKVRDLPHKKIKKLIFSWGLTFIVLLLTIIDIILFSVGIQVGAVQFNVFYIAYNTYTVAISILYWPTDVHEFTHQKDEVEEQEQLIKSDEHFESYH